jgi:hypothetical protein
MRAASVPNLRFAMPPNGVFSITSAAELREKLRHDLNALKADPFDPYLGFNFFVTAEHLLDWQYPGDTNNGARTAARRSSVLLQIASHIANGAKHFVVERSHHKSVAKTSNQLGAWGNAFGDAWGASFGRVGLIIELEAQAAGVFGQSVKAVDLAEKLLTYWDSQAL